MGENAELQEEELEVLKSIYEGDDLYTNPDKDTHQYKFGEVGTLKTFILEIKWTDEYPSELPALSLESFYNKHLVPEVKTTILKAVSEEAEQFLGMSMTYSLFEWVRESLETLLEKQPETLLTSVCEEIEEKCSVNENDDDDETTTKTKVKKEQLTKAQKRAQWKKGGVNEEDRERGWNWVDIVRHLSQTRDTD